MRGDSYIRVTECVECGREESLPRNYLCYRCNVILGYVSEEEQ